MKNTNRNIIELYPNEAILSEVVGGNDWQSVSGMNSNELERYLRSLQRGSFRGTYLVDLESDVTPANVTGDMQLR